MGGQALLTGACALQADLGAALEGGDFLGVTVTSGAAGELPTMGKMEEQAGQLPYSRISVTVRASWGLKSW